MSANRRQTVLASAALVAGALLMTACQDSDSGAAQGASSNPPGAQAPAPPNTANSGGGQGGNGQGGQSGQSGQGANSGGGQSSGKDSGGQGTGSGGGSGSNSGTSAGSGSGTGAASNGGNNGDGKNAKCRTDQLKTSAVDSTIDGDRSPSVAVTFKNTGSDCSMAGYAGVDLKTNAGDISAERTGQEPVSIILKSGESVSFGINYPVETMEGSGSGLRITGLVVTPPDETKSVTLTWPGAASLPVKSGPALTVGPIGSAGQGG
ncbi:DUF4232 domain-containing protein [Streptodolium elevatio]|uniref:DUF4232 domain-containing protein n=1 Tax=Streptodolium elevatio TaxID=3157996 RepID=A0ABV3DVS8_9ACTN